ncbi:Alpha-1,2 mannosyltransferase KTR1 [Wickerhamomyces ciferrii]|uniref:Alpha-1,2 mannosyltransferase KTR1 n=1 Tax=Wickerhamomyces ciferrii (strain ATCC 14091 / BCRC 22168 / CBS 111 / JCM 3599 / NBRC 0793 / NRRL Y-1031 F-60-10) TaxID=1206466 RepID=K0KMH1_WICCF|nr:Alpha-1,2 mannosyltransferase KTR1 [Wickerhamomyces ciferrii]CCH43402.1 Alpha-1,2 mannosyltransferase KTR1 [Wickerhamomyces ciferrii]
MVRWDKRRTRIVLISILSSIIIFSSIIAVRNNHHKAAIEYLDKITRLKVLQTLYPDQYFNKDNYTDFQFLDPSTFNIIRPKLDEEQKENGNDNEAQSPEYERENASFFSLVRNEELHLMLQSINYVEERFNKKYNYPWIFANNVPFSDTFKKEVSNLVSGKTTFVTIPKEYWSYPESIDQLRAAETRERMIKENVKYGGSESYRHMCRFNSGFFYKLKELQNLKYYWRVEPDIKFTCDINYDPFKFMREHKKKYGFTMALHELHRTVYGLLEATKEFFHEKHPDYIAKDNTIGFITMDNEETFNMCHFWSNFEIGDLDFLRSKQYEEYFQHLDSKGGFFYERWGDAPIHTFAVAYMLNKEELHYFDNTGYYHVPHTQCPKTTEKREELRCICSPGKDYNWGNRDSCLPHYYDSIGEPRPAFAPRKNYITEKEHPFKKRELEQDDTIEERDFDDEEDNDDYEDFTE